MNLTKLLVTIVSVVLLTGCDMMTEDEDLTNCGLFVTFKYDYNLQRSDQFGDHVGGVTLYVFDSDGHFLRSYENNDVPSMAMMLDGSYTHAMQILDLPDGKYRLIALANQKGYEATLQTPGAKYRRSALAVGDDNELLTVTLDREAPQAEGANPRVSSVAPLDTLWHGMTGVEPVEVKSTSKTVAHLSMVRDTKMLTIGLHNLDNPKDISTDEFDYFIVDRNGRLGYNNGLLPDDDLVYPPFRTWDSESADADGTTLNRTAHACLTFNRLWWYEQPDQNALLVIRNRQTGSEVCAVNLTDFLSQGRNAYDLWAYSRQEYLDRAYDFYLDFFIRNQRWQYADVRIGVLSWAKRIQNVDLK